MSANDPKQPTKIELMTLGNMRALGVQRISFFAQAATMQWRHERVLRSRH
jgi:coproporphyrinogen III oxidase-like Fe-S oxidoreductase